MSHIEKRSSYQEILGEPVSSHPVGPLGSESAPAAPLLGLDQYGQQQVLYGAETAGSSVLSQNDINQGQLGDCFLLSTLMEIVRQGQLLNLNFVQNMIHQNANGTESVKLYNGGFWHVQPFQPVSETVTNVFDPRSIDGGYGQDLLPNGTKEIWPQVLEKAYAQLAGGYNAITNGGFDIVAMEDFTGKVATTAQPAAQTYASLIQLTNAHDLLTFDTPNQPNNYNTNLPGHLIGDHSYAFEGFVGTTALKVGNPWGPAYGPDTVIPISQLGSAFYNLNIGHVV